MSKMAIRNGISVFTLFFMSNQAFGQPSLDEIMPDYDQHHASLSKKYLTNMKLVFESTGHNLAMQSGVLEGTTKGKVFFGNSVMRGQSEIHHPTRGDTEHFGYIYTFDELYLVKRKNEKHVIVEHEFDSHNTLSLGSKLANIGAFVPFTSNGWIRLRELDISNSEEKQRGRIGQFSFVSASPTNFNGQSAVMLTIASRTDSTTKSYLDPSNDYALLGYETDVSKLAIYGRNSKHGLQKVIGTVTYEPSKLGYPVPKKYVSKFVKTDGTTIPRDEINYLEWSRYTPQPDEFDLEKQFGVKPLPRPDNVGPPLPAVGSRAANKGWGRWLWIAAGVLALVTATLIGLRIRGRSRSRNRATVGRR